MPFGGYVRPGIEPTQNIFVLRKALRTRRRTPLHYYCAGPRLPVCGKGVRTLSEAEEGAPKTTGGAADRRNRREFIRPRRRWSEDRAIAEEGCCLRGDFVVVLAMAVLLATCVLTAGLSSHGQRHRGIADFTTPPETRCSMARCARDFLSNLSSRLSELTSDQRLGQTLSLMALPKWRLTSEVAREVCQRTSAAVISGYIAQVGTRYLLPCTRSIAPMETWLASAQAQA